MPRPPLTARTHCDRGHDLSLPGALGKNIATGWSYCTACRRARNESYRQKQVESTYRCDVCGRRFLHRGKQSVCDRRQCRLTASRAPDAASDAERTRLILELCVRRESTPHYLRDALDRRIQELTA